MSDSLPLYNSRLPKIYVQYVRKHYPDIDVDSILQESGIANYELEDPSHWFNQEQIDRFHDIIVARTGNPDISREAGRFSTSSEGLGATKQYILGLMSPTEIFLLLGKVYPLLSRAADVRSKKLGPTAVEVVASIKPGVNEKPYQCANRMGAFESTAKFFTDKFANIEHPSCIHRGDEVCRYIITWNKTPKILWIRIRNYILSLNILALIALLFVIPFSNWVIIGLICALITLALSYYTKHLESKALIKTIETQTEAAQDSIYESNTRYNNAMLVQEIGQATANILDIDELLVTVVGVMEKRLDFDRGMIMLVDKKNDVLRYSTGYGQDLPEEEILKDTEFHLNNPESKGLFVLAIKEQRPFLINNIREIQESLSQKSLEIAKQLGSQSLICVPIIYEKRPFGILAVDNSKSSRPLRQSDMSLLIGVASQLAISMANAMSFEKLHNSEKKYRELVENANSIILRVDTEGKISYFNEFAQRFFGYSEKELIGKNAGRIILPASGPNQLSFRKLISSLRNDPSQQMVSENETKTRSREVVWIAWTYKPIFNDAGHFIEILCIGNDITELKWASKEKEELQAQLQRAQKMEAIGTLAGGVAHDLNNILSGIVSYPELLLMDLKTDSPLRKPILTIQKSGEKAAAIVQDLLTLARRGVEATEVVNLNLIVSEYLLSPEHAKLELNHSNVNIERILDENLLNILGSPVHLSKTIMNLVSNAAEAMLDGGTIVITTENRHIDKIMFGFDDINKGDYATIKVTDTGIGISPEDIERIFEPFYTKKTMGRSGTGLGMAVVWGTVKDHRGYIDITSTEGQGTEITLYFPITRKVFHPEAEIASIQELMGTGESILVVDDIEAQRQIASEMLQKLGYRVTTVSSGEEAVAYMHEHMADLLVLDMIMEPGIDGLETYREILKIYPGQKSIIASGYSESVRVKEALELGAGTYVKKPYLLEKIGRAIRAELER
ncbi:Adenylate cyclase (EC [Olavius sp. associated proteobacterium Delta 1]|nr:Adenylate cyclase (EC [Olavius sp. associated proteobacterium Delta 1]